MTLDNLLRLVSVDDGLEGVKSPSSHDVANSLLLDPEPLDLVVDVEKQGVVSGRVVARTDEEAAGTSWKKSIKNTHVKCNLKQIPPHNPLPSRCTYCIPLPTYPQEEAKGPPFLRACYQKHFKGLFVIHSKTIFTRQGPVEGTFRVYNLQPDPSKLSKYVSNT